MKIIAHKLYGVAFALIALSASQTARSATSLVGDHSVVSNPALFAADVAVELYENILNHP
jgi:hypothetical protein